LRASSIRIVVTTIVSVLIGVWLVTPAFAQDTTTDDVSNDQIVLNGELTIAEGQTVDTAVIFHGPATIQGTVTGSVVVFDGRADISGVVQDDVVVFNGDVHVLSGGEVAGDVVSRERATIDPGGTVGGDQRSIDARFDAADVGFASRIAWWIGYSVSTLVLGLLLLLIAPSLDLAIVRAARERMGAALGLGALGFFLLPIVGVLLLAVVVALPLGLFLLMALALLYTVGYVTGAHALGRMLVKPPRSRFVAFLVGWAILRIVALVPVAGGLLWLIASILGLGILWVAARRQSVETYDTTVPPAVPPPPTVPA